MSPKDKVDLCKYITPYWDMNNNNPLPTVNKVTKNGPQLIADQYPTKSKWQEEFFLLPKGVNGLKGIVSHLPFIISSIANCFTQRCGATKPFQKMV